VIILGDSGDIGTVICIGRRVLGRGNRRDGGSVRGGVRQVLNNDRRRDNCGSGGGRLGGPGGDGSTGGVAGLREARRGGFWQGGEPQHGTGR
jgi:hypothetical protein